MKRKLLCLLLSLVLLAGLLPGTALAAETAQVWVTVAAGGELKLAARCFTVTDTDGDGVLSVADALSAAHAAACPGGLAVENTQYGLSLTRLWGDEGPAFGYQVNDAAAWSLADPVRDGDRVTAYAYADQSGWSDVFTWFDRAFASVVQGQSLTVTLNAGGYDTDWTPITLPMAGAELTLDGTPTGVFTDARGTAVLPVSLSPGTHTLSAVSADALLVPPVCRLTVAAEPAAAVRASVPGPRYGAVGGEWAVIGLARSSARVEEDWFTAYYADVEAQVKACRGVLSGRKYTEYARVVLALTAIGRDARAVAGYDLLAPLLDTEAVSAQGINGIAWALIALDARADTDTAAARAAYAALLLDRALPSGGWGSSSAAAAADPDLTAMVLTALAPHLSDPAVTRAADAALAVLSAAQQADGGFASSGVANAESCAQVIVALCSLDIDLTDSRFVKNGRTVRDALLDYTTADGYAHTVGGKTGAMAGEQALLALTALARQESGQPALYTMTDAVVRGSTDAGLPGRNAAVQPVPLAAAPALLTDIAGLPQEAAIHTLADRGIVDGMGDGTFAPNASMTRAQFAAIVVRALGLSPQYADVFTDVPADAWYAGYVVTAYTYGIVTGRGGGRFAPQDTITRQEAAVMAARAAALCGLDTAMTETEIRNMLAQFGDYICAAGWAQPGLAWCYKAGVLDQRDLDISPAQPILRGEVAGMLCAVLSLARLV